MLLQDMMERGAKQRIYVANSRICQSIYCPTTTKEWEAFTLTNLVSQPS